MPSLVAEVGKVELFIHDSLHTFRTRCSKWSRLLPSYRPAGGAVGLAVIGGVAWTVVNKHVRDSLSHVAAGHNLAGHGAGPGSPIYDHALSSGVTAVLAIGAGATVLALIVTVIAIRVRREDLPDSPPVM
jgi:hypothetical protein